MEPVCTQPGSPPTGSPRWPWRRLHFVGIGGVGMSGLATICLDLGLEVSGSDPAVSSGVSRLRRRGVRILPEHRAESVHGCDRVVFSSAVAADNPELLEAARLGIPTVRRGAFLGDLAQGFRTVIAVAGSHGKTTTSAMVAHVLRAAGRRPGFMVGGDVTGWASPAAAGAGDILVTEVDESDGTQVLVRSTVGVITNIDDDHCWSVGGVEALERIFVRFAESAATVVAGDSPATRRLLAGHPCLQLQGAADLPADLRLSVPGEHNRTNAALALRAALAVGVPRATALAALASFRGVQRRLTEWFRAPDGGAAVIDDYAHHPAELRASLAALRQAYPGFRLVCVFQPHRFERVKRYAADFATELAAADQVVVVTPFAAWLQDRDLADPRQIAADVRGVPSRFSDAPLPQLADELVAAAAADPQPVLFAVIGAGDVTRLAPLVSDRLVAAVRERCAAALRAEAPGMALVADRPWRAWTTLGVGTACPLVAQPATTADLQAALRVAAGQRLPVCVLGAGSNLVGTDDEPPRLVMRLARGEFAASAPTADGLVTVGAGARLATLVRECLAAGALDPAAAPLAWIPGTVGGALRMNAGAHGTTLGRYVVRLCGVRSTDGQPWACAGTDVTWGYRQTDIPADVILTQAVLRLGPGSAAAARRRLRVTGKERRARQPAGRSAGCVLRNAGALAAGRLLDECGCKGLSEGACRVSHRHANFIVNTGGASESEFVDLLLRVQRRAYDATGVRLIPEVIMVGSKSASLVQESLAPLRIVVLKGGPSKEAPVSLRSGAAVARALREAGHQVTEVELTDASLPELPADTDVVFPALHGEFGEDGQVQQLLEDRGLPYVGSGVEASRLIMDKLGTKDVVRAAGVPTPASARLTDPAALPPAGVHFPLVVKPNRQGSTIGMMRLLKPSGWWRRALEAAFSVDTEVFVEEFVAGTEITVGVLHGRALPVVEIVPPRGRMFDYDAKYDHKRGHTQYLCPPKHVSAAMQKRCQALAETVFRTVGARDLLRCDFIIDAAGTPWFLEANSIPGFTATSLMPMASKQAGIEFPELCSRLVRGHVRG